MAKILIISDLRSRATAGIASELKQKGCLATTTLLGNATRQLRKKWDTIVLRIDSHHALEALVTRIRKNGRNTSTHIVCVQSPLARHSHVSVVYSDSRAASCVVGELSTRAHNVK